MHRILALTFLVILAPAYSQDQAKPANNSDHTHESQQTAQSPPGIRQAQINENSEGKASQNQRPATERSSFNGLNIALTIVIALAACVQAGVAIWQSIIYKRQYNVMSDALIASNKSAEAAAKGVAAIEKLERPFLMIEVRGEITKGEVWIVNKGKLPAQIVWINEFPIPIWPRFDEELPDNYEYGAGYHDSRVEIINIEWIAPKQKRMVARFDAGIVNQLSDGIRSEISTGNRVLYLLSAIKYRGMLSDTIFESRWCFRWGGPQFGLRLAGPYGYNRYT
ncbi:MAG TPA: hypothetical protein VGG85_15085 [Terracidiphilus sp.]|jgi:hypothetical protein